MAKKKVKARKTPNKVSYKKLLQLLLKHKKIKVLLTDEPRSGKISHERILTIGGGCVVRYPHEEYVFDRNSNHVYDEDGVPKKRMKYSRYRTSCFREDIDFAMKMMRTNKFKAELIVRAMQQHDSRYIYTRAVYVGRQFKKKVA